MKGLAARRSRLRGSCTHWRQIHFPSQSIVVGDVLGTPWIRDGPEGVLAAAGLLPGREDRGQCLVPGELPEELLRAFGQLAPVADPLVQGGPDPPRGQGLQHQGVESEVQLVPVVVPAAGDDDLGPRRRLVRSGQGEVGARCQSPDLPLDVLGLGLALGGGHLVQSIEQQHQAPGPRQAIERPADLGDARRDEGVQGLVAVPLAERNEERQGCGGVGLGLPGQVRGEAPQGGALAGTRGAEQGRGPHLLEGLEDVLVLT